ncbi:MAG: hypothetical protein Kow0069_15530 [Promethearchaeota archaeon]
MQNILAARLSCETRKTFAKPGLPNVEVDLVGDGFWAEVKVDGTYYDGVGQLVAQRALHGDGNLALILIHVRESIEEDFRNATRAIGERERFGVILVDSRRQRCEVAYP